MSLELITDAIGGKKIFPDTRFTPKSPPWRDMPLYKCGLTPTLEQ